MLYPRIFNNTFTDDLFDDLFFPVSKKDTQSTLGTFGAMRTDVKEYDDRYELEIDLPGLTKDDVKAELKDGLLTITAEKKQETDESKDDGKFIRKERYYGKMQRSFCVGDDIKHDDIKANFAEGVLRLMIPKKAAEPEVEEAKTIPIE